jgi:inner membrane protein
MDTVTHMLLGAATAQLGFRRRIGPSATWMAAGAAALPDLDIFFGRWATSSIDGSAALSHMLGHRGITHSLLVAPVLALLAVGLWGVARRVWPARWRSAAASQPTTFWLLYAAMLVAVLTHPLLDWCTAFGTQLLAPITDTRYAIDCVAVVDLFFTGILAVTLLACYIVRRAGRGRVERTVLIIGWAGFLACVGYLVAGRVLHDRAISPVTEGHYINGAIRADAYPALGSLFLWRVVIETDREFLTLRYRPLSGTDYQLLFGQPDSSPIRGVPKQDDPWIERARRLPIVQSYEWFAMGRGRAETTPDGPDQVVEFHDMRYGQATDSLLSMWPLRVRFGPDGQVLEARRSSPYPNGGFWGMVSRTWQDITAP